MSLLRPRPGILDIDPYVGGEARLPGHNRVIRLASNENPLGASPRAVEAYRSLAGELHRYPDGNHLELRQAIGGVCGLDPALIACGAGSDELLFLLARGYVGPGDEVIHTRHAFAMYAIIARTIGALPVSVAERDLKADVEAILEAVTPRTRLVFLANPNNPTGTYLSGTELRRLRAGLRDDVLLVIDAAYAEYADAPDYDDGIAFVDECENVVMTRTFSKIHGLAALRLGWAYGPADVIGVLNRVRGPFNVASAALAAGKAAIEDRAHVDHSRRHNAEWRSRLAEAIGATGLEVPPTSANFVLIRFPAEDGRDAQAAIRFLNARGIIPRRMGGYGLPDCLRITVGTAEDNEAVIEALGAFMER